MLVYLAGPYSAATPEGVQKNIEEARQVAIELWHKGLAVHCPHLNTAHFENDCQCSWEDYLRADEQIISRCDAVCMMPEWPHSKGASREHDYAQDRGIPIFYYPDTPTPSLTERTRPIQVAAYIDLLMRQYRLHLKKNADYSPANILATTEIGVVVRMWDKMARLLNLTGFRIEIASSKFDKPLTPNNEAIEDSFDDISVYGNIAQLLKADKWGK